ncbi:tankyrase-1-like [Trichogramma pretiosum]|uniref:tankyrase-1-like n=1 Tax=Trichogramma pretiosum TaxID=7493 RepID=UPI0006C99B24|nr:tankyrase-1-like [Trichogramma pretiosum]XP_014232193.1 tankyrase-1-like [Trichogramma pretiosum]
MVMQITLPLTKKIFNKNKSKKYEERIIAAFEQALASGVSVNNLIEDKEENTALHYAVQRRFKKVVLFLLKQGADVSIQNSQYVTPISNMDQWRYEEQKPGTKEIREALLLNIEEHTTSPKFVEWGITKFHMKCALGHLEELKVMAQESPCIINQVISLNSKLYNGWAPIHLAIWYGHFEVAHWLLDIGADPHVLTKSQETILHIVSERFRESKAEDEESAKLAERLINMGTDVDSANVHGLTPLAYACFGNHSLQNTLRLVEMLLSYDASVSTLAPHKIKFDITSAPGKLILRRMKQDELLDPKRTNEKTKQMYASKCELYRVECDGDVKDLDPTEECQAEINRMDKLGIRGIIMNANCLQGSESRVRLRKVLASPTFDQDYPNYGYLLKLRFQRKLKMSVEATYSLMEISSYRLPFLCAEDIVWRLSDKDVTRMLQSLAPCTDNNNNNNIVNKVTSPNKKLGKSPTTVQKSPIARSPAKKRPSPEPCSPERDIKKPRTLAF